MVCCHCRSAARLKLPPCVGLLMAAAAQSRRSTTVKHTSTTLGHHGSCLQEGVLTAFFGQSWTGL
jgi:hypothetical protein